MTNVFQSTPAWEVNTEKLLGEGNHIVTIKDAEDGTSSGGHPQITLQMANIDGEIRDWLVITENSVGKIVALAEAASVRIPTDEDIEDGLRLKQLWIDQLVGKMVGIVVRDEPSLKNPEQMMPRVQGYVLPARIKGSDVPNGSAGFTHAQAKADDKPVPF